MAAENAIPVIVGVGDVKNPSTRPEDAVEPLHLMLQAIRHSIEDASAIPNAASKLQSSIDSIDVVRTWTWPYSDLPGLLAQRLGVQPQHTFYSEHGGNQPAKLCDEAARRISLRQCKVAVITGGEALASLGACAVAKKFPPPSWTKPDEDVKSVFSPTNRELPDDIGGIHSIGAPIHIYPLYENARRAYKKQSLEENNQESACLYAEFAKVAEQNPMAWNYGNPAATEEVIGTVSKKNRMICFPYPLLMNAFNAVNLASACLLTSTEFAEEVGIPKDRWVYPLGGAGTSDSNNFWERPNYYTSPSISRSLDAALTASQLDKGQIDLFDFYSCFPIVPKLACNHLGLPTTNSPKPLTLLGGLTSFGGAGNNYSMHAIVEMVRQLRNGARGQHGLILANGGVLSYQHVICLSTQPRKAASPYPEAPPLPKYVDDVPIPSIEPNPQGEATIETYTVEFDRNGAPSRAFVIGRLGDSGRRFVANHADATTLRLLANGSVEPVGKKGWVTKEVEKGLRNIFTLEKSRL